MEGTKRALKYQYKESKISISKFWIGVIIVDIFAIFINKYTSVVMGVSNLGTDMDANLSIMTLNFLPIIVYLIVYSYEMYYKQFPIALSFSMTRKDFFKSMVPNNIGITFIFAIIQSVLLKIDPMVVKASGSEPIYDLISFNLKNDSLLFFIFSLFIAFIAFITIWNLIAVLNYKLGPVFWIGIGVITFLTTMFMGFNIIDIVLSGNWLNARLDILQFTKLSGLTILTYIIIYFVLITTNVKRNK